MSRRLRALSVVCLWLGALAAPVWLGAAHAQPARDDLERDRRLVETYRQMLADEPGQEYAFRRLLETAHAVGGVVGLVQLYRAEVDKDPRNYAAWLVLGNLHRTADNGELARDAFEKAADLKPERAEPHLLTAALHRDKRDFAAAFAAYERAVMLLAKRHDKDGQQEALRAAAETAVEAKDSARAKAWFEQLAQTEPHNLFLRMQAASALARLSEPALALEEWRNIEAKAQGQLQHLVVIWKEIGELEALLGRYAEAEATWRKGLEKLPAGHYERRTFVEGLVALYRRQDRLRELAVELEPKAGRDVELLLTLARIHEELAEDDKALAYYREAQKKRPADEEARMAALRILERIGRPEDVLGAWLELVRAFPREPRYQLKLAELYFQHGKPREAGELLRKSSRGHPADPGVHAQIVDLWLRYGDKAARAEVESEYKVLQRLEPEEPSHVMSLGELYWSGDDKARALETWKRLLKMGRKKGEGHHLLGETLAEHEQHELALAELRAAQAEDPDNPRYARALATLFEKLGKTQEALAEWGRIIERGNAQRATPEVREARERVIQLWDKGERLSAEIAELTRRFAAEPPDLAAGRFLAVALLRLGRTGEARAALERLDALVADDLEVLSGLEQVYTRMNEPRRAMQVLERLAAAAPRAAVEYMYRAAELALSLGDEASALKAARQVVELAPADASAHARVGDLYARMGYRSEAAEAWRQALTLDPRNFPVRFKLASLYRDIGSAAREEQVLAEIVREAPDGADVLRAGKRLLQLALATGRLAEVEALLRPLAVPSAGGSAPGRGKGAQLRLMVEVYGHLAQALRFSNEPPEKRAQQLAELGERGLRPLLEALEDNDVATRARAIETLELTHPAGATPALARLAAEPESMAQALAISALGRIGTSGAVAALGRLGAASQAQTRELALWALGLAPTSEAAAVLGERAKRGTPRDRMIVAAALGHGRHPDSWGLALELARDRSSDVREAGIWALGRSRRPEAVRELAERLARPTTAREAQLAAWGLGQIATAEARAALVSALWSGNAAGADDAIWSALAYPPEASSNDALVEASYLDLAQRDRNLVQPIRPTLYLPEVPDGPPRAGVLAELAGEPGREGPLTLRLRAILERPEAAPKLALAEALMAQAGALSLLPPRLGEAGSTEGAALTAKLLGWLAEPLLASVAGESAPKARDAWLMVLARWSAAGHAAAHAERLRSLALAALVGADGADAPVRGALLLLAAEARNKAALAKLEGGPQGLSAKLTPTLARFTRAAAPETRAALARTLSVLADAPSLALLAELIQDPVPLVRIAVAQAIAEERCEVDAALVADLFDLVRDPLPDVGVAAVGAILAQGRPELTSRLAGDPTPHVQRALRGATP